MSNSFSSPRAALCLVLALLAVLCPAVARCGLTPANALVDGGVSIAPRERPLSSDELPQTTEQGQRLALRVGTFLGQLELAGSWSDFRGQAVLAGTYSLCYALQPHLKEHVGVDSIRDFAALVSHGRDDERPCVDWLNASRRVSGTGHPAVLALVPDSQVVATGSDHPDWRVLTIDVAGQRIGFVVAGRAIATEAF